MKDFSGCTRTYYHTGAAYYAASVLGGRSDGLVDEIMLSMAHEGGGTMGEFAVRWLKVGGQPAARLEVFGDAWAALAQFPDFLAELAKHDGLDLRPVDVVAILNRLGIEDRTARTP